MGVEGLISTLSGWNTKSPNQTLLKTWWKPLWHTDHVLNVPGPGPVFCTPLGKRFAWGKQEQAWHRITGDWQVWICFDRRRNLNMEITKHFAFKIQRLYLNTSCHTCVTSIVRFEQHFVLVVLHLPWKQNHQILSLRRKCF